MKNRITCGSTVYVYLYSYSYIYIYIHSYPVCVRAYTVNSLFFIVEIFSDAHVVRKCVTRILFHYEIFSPTKYYLIRIFRTKVRTLE